MQSIVIPDKSKDFFSYHQNRRHLKRYDKYHQAYEKIIFIDLYIITDMAFLK